MIILTLADRVPAFAGDYIGADRGALVLARSGVRMKLALGDFDSVTEEEFALIEQWSDEVIRLHPIKDDSDSEAAVNEAMRRGYRQIVLWNPFGGRADHAVVNLRLAEKNPGTVILRDEQNEVQALGPGVYEFAPEYAYFSLFALADSKISLTGMKYPLEHRKITPADLYGLSNEISGAKGTLTIHSGCMLVIRSEDKKKIS